MSATSIFFAGRLISIPGSYSDVDASGLAGISLSASGILALVGTARGGIPYTVITGDDVKSQLQVANSPQQPFGFFRSGDLREAAAIAFDPSNDEDIPSGAMQIVFLKANPATQSTATLDNTDGHALVLTSKDYGYHTRQIKIAQGNGTTKGKMYTITFEGTIEVLDDLGGDNFFSLIFLSGTPGSSYTTVTATLSAASVLASFTIARAGLDSDFPNNVVPGAGFELASNAAGDNTQTITVYGLSVTNVAQTETLALAGVTIVPSTKTWNSIHGVICSAALAGTVTITRPSGGLIICTLVGATLSRGLWPLVDVSVAGEVLNLVLGGAGTEYVTVVGLATNGSVLVESKQLAGAVPVATTGTWSRGTYLAVGALGAAKTLTVSASAVKALCAGYDTLQKVADLFNSTPGWTFAMLTGQTSFNPANMDRYTAVNCKSPANPAFQANIYSIAAALTSQSQFVNGARGTPGTGAPTNTVAAVYLAGGNEGSATPGSEATPTATSNDYQAAINLLKKVFVNTVVPVTADPVVHAQAKSHAAYMCGAGRKERDVKVGMLNAGMTDRASKTEIKSQIVNLNSRHVQAVGQSIDRYNTTGDRQTFLAPFMAALVGGMQCGARVGTPLTHKYINALAISQDNTWNANDNAEEMIQAGLCFAETIDGVGRRIVRGITTHLTTSNIAYTEASVNEALNYSVYNYRTTLEIFVGKAGFAGTVTAARGGALQALELLLGVSLIAYRSLILSMTLDVIETAVEMAPVLPVNFVKSTIHVVTVSQSAT
jgi:hypothetical protein